MLWLCCTIVYRNKSVYLTVVSRHFVCTQETIKLLQRQFRFTGNVADCPQSGRPLVTTTANDCYIALRDLRNRRLTAAATGRQYGIHPQTVRNRLRQNVQPIHVYRLYFPTSSNCKAGLVPPSPAISTCWFGIWFCFPMNDGLTLAMPTEAREFISVRESVLSMRASLGRTVLVFWRWFSHSLCWDNGR